ncbi:ScbR family autoregulator-binding transcription factor [Angustibacter sp. McL0619]|uniref:ScbR family autoregulator-binding transcription factor n=1 Tax=Angustibacter sp. McL0619 TaxID=3415676 RepID=UPI003CF698AB
MAQHPRAQATRQGILEAAARVFDEMGYDAATISDVVATAGCTRGALYFHFPSKEAVADAIIAEQGSWLADVGEGTGSPVQVIVDGSYAFAAGLREDVMLRASIRLTVQTGTFDGRTAQAYRVWADAVHRLLRSARAQGHLRQGRGLGAVAECLTASITGIQLTSEALTDRQDLEKRLYLFWRLVLPSVLTAEHLETLRLTPPRRVVRGPRVPPERVGTRPPRPG